MAKRLFDEEGNEVKGVKVKKPFYKRWWFIALAVIVVISLFTGGNEDEETTTKEEDNTVETVVEAEAEEEEEEEAVEEEEEVIEVTADELLRAYTENEVNANSIYKGNLVEVTGTLNSISESDSGKVSLVIKADSDDLWLEDISVELVDKTGIENVTTDDKITVKGVADTGILRTVKLTEGIIVE